MLSLSSRIQSSAASPSFCRFCRFFSVETNIEDYYSVLGVDRTASANSIKSAFYELSKKYHPDRQIDPDNKQSSAEKFRKVVIAYEILGSVEKRKAYDNEILRQQLTGTCPDKNPKSLRFDSIFDKYQAKTRRYTDLDIDYKTFEQFQRNTRLRRRSTASNNHSEMPYEFYADFGQRKFSSIYMDSAAARRLKQEAAIEKEMEELKKKQRFRTPTFAELSKQREKKAAEEMKANIIAAAIATTCTVALLIIRLLR